MTYGLKSVTLTNSEVRIVRTSHIFLIHNDRYFIGFYLFLHISYSFAETNL